MNIHKHITKIALSLAALFWAGCDDNGTNSNEQAENEVVSSSSESSSSEESSSSVESESSSSSAAVDREAALQRGYSLCADNGGLKESAQYQPHWGSAETNADSKARSEVQDSVSSVLESDAAKLSTEKKSCLQQFVDDVQTVCMYGSPMPDDENPYDAWEYTCKDGTVVKDAEYQRLDKEYDDAFDAAKKESLKKYQKEVSDNCDSL